MKNPLEILVSLLAPHICIECGSEGSLLCLPCSAVSIVTPPSRCYKCHKASRQCQVCPSCRRKSTLKNLWVAAEYDGVAKKLIYKVKFDRAKAGAEILAEIMAEVLPDLPKGILVTHVPTANKRIRIRGYDQSKLAARSMAKKRGWAYEELLIRRGSSRQVGSSRSVRLAQLNNAFKPKRSMHGQRILLVDDVTSTGATLETAAKVVKKAGAGEVLAIVFAQPSE